MGAGERGSMIMRALDHFQEPNFTLIFPRSDAGKETLDASAAGMTTILTRWSNEFPSIADQPSLSRHLQFRLLCTAQNDSVSLTAGMLIHDPDEIFQRVKALSFFGGGKSTRS